MCRRGFDRCEGPKSGFCGSAVVFRVRGRWCSADWNLGVSAE